VATIIKEEDDAELFRFITDRNLLAQYDALELEGMTLAEL